MGGERGADPPSGPEVLVREDPPQPICEKRRP
jgi:hypothetical protein